MKNIFFACVFCLTAGLLLGCPPLEETGYQAVVAANAFVKSMRAQHPECASPVESIEVCEYLSRAASAKDTLIDAAEVYCAGPDFNGGGKCDAPQKGMPGAAQLTQKLQEAISSYKRAEADLKGVVAKKKIEAP